MGQTYEALKPEHETFIARQPVFFVATAPLTRDGHVNLSPKGYDSFRIFSPNQVGYLDLTGSGNETSAHLLENGRITFMFMAIEGSPQILRLYGTGRVILPSMSEWDELARNFPMYPGIRQIIVARIHKVTTSCGYGVPLLSYDKDRDTLHRWAEAKGPEGLRAYHQEKNAISLDGLMTPLAVDRDESANRP